MHKTCRVISAPMEETDHRDHGILHPTALWNRTPWLGSKRVFLIERTYRISQTVGRDFSLKLLPKSRPLTCIQLLFLFAFLGRKVRGSTYIPARRICRLIRYILVIRSIKSRTWLNSFGRLFAANFERQICISFSYSFFTPVVCTRFIWHSTHTISVKSTARKYTTTRSQHLSPNTTPRASRW